MKAWKSMSLGLLLALCLVSSAAASPASAPFLSAGAICAAAAPAATPASAAEPLAALWATGAQPVANNGSGGASAAGICSNLFCFGIGTACTCSNGTRGICSNNRCIH